MAILINYYSLGEFMKPIAIVATVFIGLISLPVTAEEETKKYSVILKTGSYSLSQGTQTVSSYSTKFNKSASGVFAGEFTWGSSDDIRFGGEIFLHNNDYTSVGFKGEASTTVVMFNARKYFLEDDFRPFIGGGVGAASSDFSGRFVGSAGGLALQVMFGAEYKLSNSVSLYAEYKNILLADVDAETTTGGTAEFDLSGDGLFAGAAIYF